MRILFGQPMKFAMNIFVRFDGPAGCFRNASLRSIKPDPIRCPVRRVVDARSSASS